MHARNVQTEYLRQNTYKEMNVPPKGTLLSNGNQVVTLKISYFRRRQRQLELHRSVREVSWKW
jgi:hypothetical protein